MIQSLCPSLIIISDKYGKEPTYDQFRTIGKGLKIGEEEVKFYSTKTLGRIRCVYNDKKFNWSTKQFEIGKAKDS